MKKNLIYSLSIFLMMIIISLFGGIMVNADSSSFHYIVTTPGEDSSTEVRINWHSFVNGSYLEYTLADDIDFNNSIEVLPTQEEWSTNGLVNANPNSSFYTNPRFVCKASITGLTPRTNYIYRIKTDDECSDIYHFTTSGLTNDWNFCAFTDFQHQSNSITHKLVDKVRSIAGNPTLVVCSGDMVDTAGNESEWKWLMDSEMFKNFTYASSPGDHEYWGDYQNDHSLKLDKPHTYNALFNNPQNGCEDAMNSSCYFYYNNVLFFLLDFEDSDTVTSTKLSKEMVWFTNKVKELEGTFQYLIVLEHKSIYGSYTTDSRVAKTMRPAWYPVFDEAGVDIVFSGHDHMYSRTYKLYNNKVSQILTQGTYYVDMGTSGDKTRVPDEGLYTDRLHEKILNLNELNYACGADVRVTSEKIEVNIYNTYGALVDSFTTYPSRAAKEISYDAMDFGNITSDANLALTNVSSQTGLLSLGDDEALRNLSHVTLLKGDAKLIDVPFSYGNTNHSYNISGLDKTDYTLILTLLDGSETNIDLHLNYFDFASFRLRENKGVLKLYWNKHMSEISSQTFDIYIDGTLYKQMKLDEIGVGSLELDNKYLIGEHSVLVKVGEYSDTFTYTGVNALTLDKESIELFEGDTTTLSYYFELDDLIEVFSSDNSVVTYDDGLVRALKAGNAKIIFKVIDSDLQYECNVKVSKKGGCNSASAISFVVLVNLAIIIMRRKKTF